MNLFSFEENRGVLKSQPEDPRNTTLTKFPILGVKELIFPKGGKSCEDNISGRLFSENQPTRKKGK